MTSDEPTRRRDGVAVTDEAIERIKAMIVSGELQPGDRLPKEDELAANSASPAAPCAKRSARSRSCGSSMSARAMGPT